MPGKIDMDAVVSFLRQKLNPSLILLYGSRAKDAVHAESDVDLAFLSDSDISEYDVFIIGQELAGMIGFEVDLVDLKKASTVLKAQIVSSARVLYSENESKRLEFYMRAFSEYARLNEDRAPVLAQIAKRGKIYAE